MLGTWRLPPQCPPQAASPPPQLPQPSSLPAASTAPRCKPTRKATAALRLATTRGCGDVMYWYALHCLSRYSLHRHFSPWATEHAQEDSRTADCSREGKRMRREEDECFLLPASHQFRLQQRGSGGSSRAGDEESHERGKVQRRILRSDLED